MKRAVWVSLIAALMVQVASAKVGKKAKAQEAQAKAQQAADQQAAMLRVRKIYVMKGGFSGRLKKGIAKSECLTLEFNPMDADAVLVWVPYKSRFDRIANLVSPSQDVLSITCNNGGCIGSTWHSGGSESNKWMLFDPKTGRPISNWSMTYFPSVKKVEKAVGCHK